MHNIVACNYTYLGGINASLVPSPLLFTYTQIFCTDTCIIVVGYIHGIKWGAQDAWLSAPHLMSCICP